MGEVENWREGHTGGEISTRIMNEFLKQFIMNISVKPWCLNKVREIFPKKIVLVLQFDPYKIPNAQAYILRYILVNTNLCCICSLNHGYLNV